VNLHCGLRIETRIDTLAATTCVWLGDIKNVLLRTVGLNRLVTLNLQSTIEMPIPLLIALRASIDAGLPVKRRRYVGQPPLSPAHLMIEGLSSDLKVGRLSKLCLVVGGSYD
jgi:hypothetical protein